MLKWFLLPGGLYFNEGNESEKFWSIFLIHHVTCHECTLREAIFGLLMDGINNQKGLSWVQTVLGKLHSMEQSIYYGLHWNLPTSVFLNTGVILPMYSSIMSNFFCKQSVFVWLFVFYTLGAEWTRNVQFILMVRSWKPGPISLGQS